MVFLEIELITNNNPLMSKKQLLAQIESRFNKTHNIKSFWKGEENNPILRIEYQSREHLETCYQRDIFLYEKILDFLNSGMLTKEELHQLNINRKSHQPLVPKIINGDERTLYLVFRYKTDYKIPLLNNYRITTRVAEYFEFGVNYEEIEDGFLIFYQNPEDFEINQLDKLQFTNLLTYFKEKEALNPNFSKILKTIFESMN